MNNTTTSIPKLPTLSGLDLVLNPVLEEHAEILFPIMSDNALMRYILPPSSTVDAAAKTLREAATFNPEWAGWWSISKGSSDAPIGLMMYYGVHQYNRYGSIAYVVDKRFQRQGIARRATSLAIDFLFDDICLNRIEAEIENDNIASARLLESLGFVCEAKILRERLWLADRFRSVALFSLIASDWNERNPMGSRGTA